MPMKTHAREGVALDKATCFLFCSGNSTVAQQLGQGRGVDALPVPRAA
mgnify:CR=1 FL=1